MSSRQKQAFKRAPVEKKKPQCNVFEMAIVTLRRKYLNEMLLRNATKYRHPN